MKLSVIEDNTMRLDGGSMFGHTPKALWEKWMPPDDKNRIPLACRTLFVQTPDGRNILFDAGIGDFFEPKFRERYGIEGSCTLLKNLDKIGVREDDIDAVILSHLHFDHAGGLLSAYEEGAPRLRFPKAKYYVGMEHWIRAKKPHLRERVSFIPILHSLLEASQRLVLIEKATHPDLDIGLTFHISNGHTLGLMISQLDLSTGPLVFAADLILGMPWIHLPITTGYDRYPELLVDEKQKLLEKLAEQNGKILFAHDPTTACAAIFRDAEGKCIGEPRTFP